MNDNYELYHHGVLGMKWGRRKTKTSDPSNTPKSPILREHGHGANRFGFGFESLKDDSLIGIFDRQLARNRKRRK